VFLSLKMPPMTNGEKFKMLAPALVMNALGYGGVVGVSDE
jgi:hypothetical protein